MKFFFLLFLAGTVMPVLAQKPVIDSVAYATWPQLEYPVISNNGKFIAYSVKVGDFFGRSMIAIQSTTTSWKMEITKVARLGVDFTGDSKYFIFHTETDSLGIVNLANASIHYIPDVSEFRVPVKDIGEWLVYRTKEEVPKMIIQNLRSGKKELFTGVRSFKLSEDGKALVFLSGATGNYSESQTLFWINMVNGKKTTIWNGIAKGDPVCDFKYNQLAILSGDSVWYYKVGMQQAAYLANSRSAEIDSALKISYLRGFTRDGGCLSLFLEQKVETTKYHASSSEGAAEIWSYQDMNLRSESQIETDSIRTYASVIGLQDKKLIRVQKYEDEYPLSNEIPDQYIVLPHQSEKCTFETWKAASQKNYDLINTYTGERKQLDFLNAQSIFKTEQDGIKVSPNGKYILYYDSREQGYLSYEPATGNIHHLTGEVNSCWLHYLGKDDRPGSGYYPRGIAGWMADGETALVYDSHDLWKLDLSGKNKPINLTNGYGRKNNIVFTIGLREQQLKIFKKNDRLILNAFDLDNMNNGFFGKALDKYDDPELLTMEPRIFQNLIFNHHFRDNIQYPIKARNAEIYLVTRMSAAEFGNYFVTRDFKTFVKITDLHPQKVYNWYTTELHHWKSLDGRNIQGVLYKPENFDPGKKYPVVFNYYEKMTGGLNVCQVPRSSYGGIDIPTFVSNGYLVFTPDIYYVTGDPMQGTYDAVVSAANYVSSLPFVNPKKMGIQGHSWGSVQTNYLVTHTDLFAAACSASGISNWISGYGTLLLNGGNPEENFEIGQLRMASSLWGNLPGYMKNSALLQAHKITTPFLLMHTKKDGICPYQNTMEFFLALRRLGKKAWMLVYSETGHTVRGKESADFTIRMMQFFDHYLKDKPAPAWMFGSGAGLLMPEEQKKVDSLLTRKPITIKLN